MSLILLNSEFETARCAQYSWNILEDVGKSTEYSWDILEYVERALGYSWSFKAWVEQALEYSWNISAWIKKQLGYSWNIFATAITSGTFVKYEFSSAKRPKAFYINILNKVIGLKAPIICYCRRALSYSWDIPGIEKALSYSWNLLNIEKALSYSWVISDCCEDVSIGYTTQQMFINEQQILSVENPIVGCTYNWAIESGGGSLFSLTGSSVMYTAPSSNENCNENPVITLDAGEENCDTLAIAITVHGGGPAYNINTCRYDWSCDGCTELCPVVDINLYNCDDAFAGYAGYCGGGSTSDGACELDCTFCASINRTSCAQVSVDGPCPQPQYQCSINEPNDLRTPAMIAAGCCPAGLL